MSKPCSNHFVRQLKALAILSNAVPGVESFRLRGRPARRFGQAKFNPRDPTHSELLVKGSQRVIAIELK
jgi:hypothetical protein